MNLYLKAWIAVPSVISVSLNDLQLMDKTPQLIAASLLKQRSCLIIYGICPRSYGPAPIYAINK
jgi:hypothetical protein